MPKSTDMPKITKEILEMEISDVETATTLDEGIEVVHMITYFQELYTRHVKDPKVNPFIEFIKLDDEKMAITNCIISKQGETASDIITNNFWNAINQILRNNQGKIPEKLNEIRIISFFHDTNEKRKEQSHWSSVITKISLDQDKLKEIGTKYSNLTELQKKILEEKPESLAEVLGLDKNPLPAKKIEIDHYDSGWDDKKKTKCHKQLLEGCKELQKKNEVIFARKQCIEQDRGSNTCAYWTVINSFIAGILNKDPNVKYSSYLFELLKSKDLKDFSKYEEFENETQEESEYETQEESEYETQVKDRLQQKKSGRGIIHGTQRVQGRAMRVFKGRKLRSYHKNSKKTPLTLSATEELPSARRPLGTPVSSATPARRPLGTPVSSATPARRPLGTPISSAPAGAITPTTPKVAPAAGMKPTLGLAAESFAPKSGDARYRMYLRYIELKKYKLEQKKKEKGEGKEPKEKNLQNLRYAEDSKKTAREQKHRNELFRTKASFTDPGNERRYFKYLLYKEQTIKEEVEKDNNYTSTISINIPSKEAVEYQLSENKSTENEKRTLTITTKTDIGILSKQDEFLISAIDAILSSGKNHLTVSNLFVNLEKMKEQEEFANKLIETCKVAGIKLQITDPNLPKNLQKMIDANNNEIANLSRMKTAISTEDRVPLSIPRRYSGS